MGGREGVVDVKLTECCQAARELRVIGFFLRMETDVFQKQDMTGLQPANRPTGCFAYAILGKLDLTAEQLRERRRDRPQRQRLIHALWAAQVRHDYHLRVSLRQMLEGWERSPDSSVVADRALVEWHVEVLAHEDPFAGDVD